MVKNFLAGFACLIFLLILLVNNGLSASFKGVSFPDYLIIGSQKCELNGVGIRKKFFIEVYYGALYLPYKTHNAEKVIQDDVPKAVIMHVVYKKIEPKKWVDGWREAFEKYLQNSGDLKNKIDQFMGFFDETVLKGGEVCISYDPGKGTEVKINGKIKGTIEGSDFMKALWEVWFGDKPVSKSLKEGMLGE